MLHSRAAHPHAPARCAAHPTYVSAHLWLSTLHRTHCLALRTRVMCWRSSAPELLGSPVPAHILPVWPHPVMAWAHAPCHFQSPAAHDRARDDQCVIAISVCVPSHPPGRVARPPRFRARSPSRVPARHLGRRRSSPTHARDARPLRSAMPACNQSLALPFPVPPHILSTCLYSFCKNSRSHHHHQWSLPISHMLFPSLFCTADG
jgi:hypothetical protein